MSDPKRQIPRRRVLSLGLVGLGAMLGGPLALRSRAVAQEGRRWSLAVLPYISASELHDRFAPLLGWLSGRLGVAVDLHVAPDYATMIDLVGRDKVELAYIGPAPFVELVNQHGPKTLLGRLSINGKATFRGAIVVRRHTPHTTLADLRGRSFAFGDRLSTMSHLVPHHMLLQAGIRLRDLSHHAFLGSHINVAEAVVSGTFDAGAVRDEILALYESRGLRALALTPEISQQVFLATNRLSAAARREVEDVFSALSGTGAADHQEILRAIEPGAEALAPVSLADFDDLNRILAELQAAGDS